MNQRYMVMLAVGAVLLIGGAAAHYAVVNAYSDHLQALQEEAASLRQQPSPEVLEAELVGLRHEVGSQAAALPDAPETGELLERLGEDVSELQLRNRSLTTGTPRMQNAVQQIPLDLSFQGSFADAFELLGRLERYERVVRVERLTIQRKPQSEAGDLSVSARLTAFARPGQED